MSPVKKRLLPAIPPALAMLVLASMSTPLLPAGAASELNKGARYYQSGQYDRAARFFRFMINRDPKYWAAYYELGNTYMKMNELGLARKAYVSCYKLTTNEKVKQLCDEAIAYIDKRLASGAPASVSPQAQTDSSSNQESDNSDDSTAPDDSTPASTRLDFKERIHVVEPQLDHQPVRQSTVENVRNTLDILPPYIYAVLNKGGATINIAPNITDKWTYLLKETPDQQTLHLEQDHARTYGRDIYIYERPLIKGTHELSSHAFDEEGIRNVLLHELGHAYDACSGTFTAGEEFMNVHRQDVDEMSPETKSRLWYYVPLNKRGAAEAFAETFAGLMGATGKDTQEVADNFPRLREWVRNKLKL